METMRGYWTLEILKYSQSGDHQNHLRAFDRVAEGTMGSGSVHSTASTGIALGASQGKVWD